MPANNIHILTKEELEFFNSKYSFSYADDMILVTTKDYRKITGHTLDRKFYLNTVRGKITITQEAMKLWCENFKDTHSLVDVQNALNTLLISYQKPTVVDLTAQLKTQKERK